MMRVRTFLVVGLLLAFWSSLSLAIVKPKRMLPKSTRSTEQVDDKDAQRAAKDLQVRRVQNMLSTPRPQNSRLSQDP